MKFLKDSKGFTGVRSTSKGNVKFKDGLASDYTEDQAKHLIENFTNYSEVTIDSIAEKQAAIDAENARKAALESSAPEKIKGNVHGLADVSVVMLNAENEPIATAVSDENGDWEFDDPKVEHSITFKHESVTEEGELKVPDASNTGDPDKVEKPLNDDGSPVVPPVITDTLKVIKPFCKKYEIDDSGTKKVILERIYADPRFKK